MLMESRLVGYSLWFIWAVAWFRNRIHLNRKRPLCFASATGCSVVRRRPALRPRERERE